MSAIKGLDVEVDFGGKPFKCMLFGDIIKHDVDDGYRRLDFTTHIPAVKNMDVDDGDVFLCAFPKSGTHWLWEIIQMLRQRSNTYHADGKRSAMLEKTDFHTLNNLQKPRLFNTHFTPHNLPKQLLERKGKIIFLQRNPKDVIVSMFPFVQGLGMASKDVEFSTFLEKMLNMGVDCGLFNWFYYTKAWHEFLKKSKNEIGNNVHLMMFEDIKEDPVREIANLSNFLNVAADALYIKKIAEMCKFEIMKEAAESGKLVVKKNHNLIFRRGEVGDWKHYFTVAQNEQFNEIYKEKMKGVDFKYRYSI